MSNNDKKVILTGIRANNDLHIGNYFGALLPMVDMAKKHAGEYQINMFVPDLHSFTTPIDHRKLQEQIMRGLKIFVAAGLPLDDDNVHIYRQSYVPAHSELTIILNSFAGFGEMSRMTQFKDKSAKLGGERVSVGLFDYPVLMSADILLHGAEYIPVGDDQSQHLEFTRNIAERMNNKFGDIFVVPKTVKEQHALFNKDQGLRIKDLSDPTKKMSKSDDSGKGIIFMGDDPAAAAKKIMGATTDNEAAVQIDSVKQPGVTNLLQILSLLNKETLNETAARYKDATSYGELKKDVAGKVQEFLTNFQQKLATVDEANLIQKLESSEKLMNQTANQTLLKVQKAVGIR